MGSTLTVTAKVIGRTKPAIPGWDIPFPPELDYSGGSLTLRDLITRIVLEEVEGFNARQEERKLTRVLSQAQIEQGAASGKIDLGGRETEQQVADPDLAVGNALLAFEDGFYFVFVDGVQQKALEQQVFVRPGSQVGFVRLMPLVGG
jgi:hypothetical protein